MNCEIHHSLLGGNTNRTKILPSLGSCLEPGSDEAGAVKRWLTTRHLFVLDSSLPSVDLVLLLPNPYHRTYNTPICLS